MIYDPFSAGGSLRHWHHTPFALVSNQSQVMSIK